VTVGAILLLLLSSLIKGWYAENALLPYGQAASLYRDHSGYAVAAFVLLLIAALILLWFAKGLWYAAIGAVAYFLFPQITRPLLVALGFPRKHDP